MRLADSSSPYFFHLGMARVLAAATLVLALAACGGDGGGGTAATGSAKPDGTAATDAATRVPDASPSGKKDEDAVRYAP